MEEKYIEALRESLFREMRRRGWNNRTAAIQCGISDREVSAILNGERKTDIKLSVIVRISEGIERPLPLLICPDEIRKDENEEVLRKVYEDLSRQLRRAGIS